MIIIYFQIKLTLKLSNDLIISFMFFKQNLFNLSLFHVPCTGRLFPFVNCRTCSSITSITGFCGCIQNRSLFSSKCKSYSSLYVLVVTIFQKYPMYHVTFPFSYHKFTHGSSWYAVVVNRFNASSLVGRAMAAVLLLFADLLSSARSIDKFSSIVAKSILVCLKSSSLPAFSSMYTLVPRLSSKVHPKLYNLPSASARNRHSSPSSQSFL